MFIDYSTGGEYYDVNIKGEMLSSFVGFLFGVKM